MEPYNKWRVGLHDQWFSRKRLPNTDGNPVDKQMWNLFTILHSNECTSNKAIPGGRWEAYIDGGENLTNFTQETLIISAADPIQPEYFDGSIIWGPVNGRIVYGTEV